LHPFRGFAATVTTWASRWVERLKNPVAIFDSVGLGFFAVAGAHKALLHGGNVVTAIVLGTVTAVGGGVMRDVLLNRVPVILAKEIYALAALAAAAIQVAAQVNGWFVGAAPWLAIGPRYWTKVAVWMHAGASALVMLAFTNTVPPPGTAMSRLVLLVRFRPL
jgi:uncharacterized membrane protein YeiH